MLPTINNYMESHYSNSNYGAHSLQVDLGNLILWYSYKTVIAFRYQGHTVVRVNDWSTTTGKHLNSIDGGDKEAKAQRIKGEDFELMLKNTLKALNLSN